LFVPASVTLDPGHLDYELCLPGFCEDLNPTERWMVGEMGLPQQSKSAVEPLVKQQHGAIQHFGTIGDVLGRRIFLR
jgi:hypothetical protein